MVGSIQKPVLKPSPRVKSTAFVAVNQSLSAGGEVAPTGAGEVGLPSLSLPHKPPLNFLQHYLGLLQHLLVPKSQHTITPAMQLQASPCVFCLRAGVLAAVYFKDQLRLGAAEVHEVLADAVLTAKAPSSQLPATQMVP